MAVMVSSTYLLYRLGSLLSLASFSSSEHKNALALRGPNGEPIATPSICWYRLPSNWNSWSFVASCRSLTIVFGLIFYLLSYVNFLQFLDNDDRLSSKRRNLSALVFLINNINDKENSQISRGRLFFFEFCDFTNNYANRKLGVNSEISEKRDLSWI